MKDEETVAGLNVHDYVPELMTAVDAITKANRANHYKSWQDIATDVRDRFTEEHMAAIEAKVPGWQTMAGYDNGQTLIHVNCVFLSFYNSHFMSIMSNTDRRLLEWVILFHDLAKIARPGVRDLTHAFRSTVMAAQHLPLAGFPTLPDYDLIFADWGQLTITAVVTRDQKQIQNNRKLPQILAGIEAMFGPDSEATFILKAILLHHSFSPVADWPNPANLTNEEIDATIDLPLWHILGPMLYVDSDAWQLYDEPMIRQQYAGEVLELLTAVENRLSSKT